MDEKSVARTIQSREGMTWLEAEGDFYNDDVREEELPQRITEILVRSGSSDLKDPRCPFKS